MTRLPPGLPPTEETLVHCARARTRTPSDHPLTPHLASLTLASQVDASYLSPNVNMASRLEAATKQFGVQILLSSDFVSMLSPTVAAQCRQIDCVTVKGSNQPVGLFTFDAEPEMIADPASGWDAYASGVATSKRVVRCCS